MPSGFVMLTGCDPDTDDPLVAAQIREAANWQAGHSAWEEIRERARAL